MTRDKTIPPLRTGGKSTQLRHHMTTEVLFFLSWSPWSRFMWCRISALGWTGLSIEHAPAYQTPSLVRWTARALFGQIWRSWRRIFMWNPHSHLLGLVCARAGAGLCRGQWGRFYTLSSSVDLGSDQSFSQISAALSASLILLICVWSGSGWRTEPSPTRPAHRNRLWLWTSFHVSVF